MFDNTGRKIFIGVIASGLLSSAINTALAADNETHYLLNSSDGPVFDSQGKCVMTPKTPNVPPKYFKECGELLDSDGDGITDDEDKCPHNTPEEISKGVYQSGPNKGCPIDSDNDGVPDYRDDCPHNTPLESSIGHPLFGPL